MKKPLPIRKLSFKKGPRAEEENLKIFFEELRRIAIDGIIVRGQIETFANRYTQKFKELSCRGYIEIITATGGRGRPGIGKVRFLRDVFVTKQNIAQNIAKKPLARSQIVPKEETAQSAPSVAVAREQEEKHVVPSVETELLHNALVFVDVANLTGIRQIQMFQDVLERVDDELREKVHTEFGLEKSRLVGTHDVNWPALMSHIYTVGTEDDIFVEGGYAYTYAPTNDMGQKQIFAERLLQANFQAIFHMKFDCDPLMAADIVHFGRDELDKDDCVELTVVLVSGDIDFWHAIKRLEEYAEKLGKKVNVWIISWEKSLNPFWNKKAKRISFTDKLPQLISAEARRRIDENKKKLQKIKEFLAHADA